MDEATFRSELEAGGYDEAEIIERVANFSNAEHTHEFSVHALILDGEISVISANGTTTCHAGDTFSLASGIPHREQYGPQGARVLVGRRVP